MTVSEGIKFSPNKDYTDFSIFAVSKSFISNTFNKYGNDDWFFGEFFNWYQCSVIHGNSVKYLGDVTVPVFIDKNKEYCKSPTMKDSANRTLFTDLDFMMTKKYILSLENIFVGLLRTSERIMNTDDFKERQKIETVVPVVSDEFENSDLKEPYAPSVVMDISKGWIELINYINADCNKKLTDDNFIFLATPNRRMYCFW